MGFNLVLRNDEYAPRPSSNEDWKFERERIPQYQESMAHLPRHYLPDNINAFKVAGILWVEIDHRRPFFSNGEKATTFYDRMKKLEDQGVLPTTNEKRQNHHQLGGKTVGERKAKLESHRYPDDEYERTQLALAILLVSTTGKEFEEWFHTDSCELEALTSLAKEMSLFDAQPIARLSGTQKPRRALDSYKRIAIEGD